MPNDSNVVDSNTPDTTNTSTTPDTTTDTSDVPDTAPDEPDTTPTSDPIPTPTGNGIYHMAFCSWGTSAAPLPPQARTDINRFVSITGKGLYGAENAGTVCVNEDFWPMRDPNNWKVLMDEGLFEVFIFSLNPYLRGYPSDSDTVNGPTATEWKIANGEYDAWLATIAGETKNFGYPVMLKIGVEMNGNEGSGSWGNSWVADYGADPDAFIACWKHIVNYFRNAGVNNVEWCISYTFESIGPYTFWDYYPGANYVDWVGVDIYQISIPDDPAYQISNFYYWAKTLGKPLSLTEWGVNWYNKNHPDADRARYINDFFAAVEARPEFKMIRYHWNGPWLFQDENPTEVLIVGPFTYQTYMPLASEAYRTNIADSRYIS